MLVTKHLQRSFRTPGRDRTGTSSHSLVFETNASTNSATGAKGHAKVRKVIDSGANFSYYRIGYFLPGAPLKFCGKREPGERFCRFGGSPWLWFLSENSNR